MIYKHYGLALPAMVRSTIKMVCTARPAAQNIV